MLTLRKYFGTIRNALYEEQLANDLGSIETAVNGIERDVTNHKRTDNAHTSSQVAHGGGLTVYEEIEIAKARIRNLVLNADGTNIKEVVDLRSIIKVRFSIQPMIGYLIQRRTSTDCIGS
ncbi:hypothetical protein P8791_01115 [Bacillus subtilis]|nr:hypothetical protein [Bacillus subtilis]MEC0319998.1 hypothetical protein [Bacillus subtilis]